MNMRKFIELIENNRFIKCLENEILYVQTYSIADKTANVIDVATGECNFVAFEELFNGHFCQLAEVDHSKYGNYYKVKRVEDEFFIEDPFDNSVPGLSGFRYETEAEGVCSAMNTAYELGLKEK